MIKLCPSWIVRDGLEAPPEDMALDRIFAREDRGLLDLFVKAGKSTESEGRIVTPFAASTSDVDRMGDIIDQKTWRLKNWRANPVILLDHNTPVVGKGKGKVNKPDDRLEIDVTWDTGEHNPAATLVAHQHKNGFRNAGSVGFFPGKAINRVDLPDGDPRKAPKDMSRWMAGHVFSHNDLLEFSTAAVPTNPKALELSLYANEAEGDDDKIARFVGESIDKARAEWLLKAVAEDETIRAAFRALIWSEATPTIPGDLATLFAVE